MIEQGRILEDGEFNVGGLAPSFMPESGYEYIAGVSGWPRPITPGLLGGSTAVDFIPPEYPGQFGMPPDYDAPPDFYEPEPLPPVDPNVPMPGELEPRYLLNVLENVPEEMTFGQIPGTTSFGPYVERSLPQNWFQTGLDENVDAGGRVVYRGLFPEQSFEQEGLESLLASYGDERDVYAVSTAPETHQLQWPGMGLWLSRQPTEISKYLQPEYFDSRYEGREGLKYADEQLYDVPRQYKWYWEDVSGQDQYYDWPLGEIPIEIGDVEAMTDPIYDIVGGGIVDAGPVVETPYG